MAESWLTRFGFALVGWLVAGVVVLLILGMWNPTLYFIVGFVGFVLAMEYSEPREARPKWHQRLRWVLVLNLMVFTYIVVTSIERAVGVAIF
jgi:hypothetical protein